MKKMIKQCGFFAVLAVTLLVTAVLITTCSDPGGGSVFRPGTTPGNIDNYVPPDGMGYFRFNFGNARNTILPGSLTGSEIEDLFFKAQIIQTGPTGEIDSDNNVYFPEDDYVDGDPVSFTDLTGAAVPLAGGTTDPFTYSVEVFAFVYIEDPDNPGEYIYDPVGQGETDEDIEIMVSGSATAKINLKGYLTGGPGSFVYNVTLPALPAIGAPYPTAYSTATLDVLGYASNITLGTVGGVTFPIDLGTAPGSKTATVAIPAGFYKVVLTLEAQGGGITYFQPVKVMRLLYVNRNMTSTMSEWEATALNKFAYEVTYNYGTSTAPETISPTLINHGNTITAPGNPTHSSPLAWNFLNWGYASTGATPFNFTTTRIIGDIKLYAKWEAKTFQGLLFALTFDLENHENEVIEFTPTAEFTRDDYYVGNVTPLKIEFDDLTDISNIQWYYNNPVTPIHTGNTLILSYGGSGIDEVVTNIDYLAGGDQEFTVTFDVDGYEYMFTKHVIVHMPY
jgi:hypothetical protein